MYLPYMRGRQFELIALRELVVKDLLGSDVVPIIEPVKLSSTLISSMEEFVKNKHAVSIIRNPIVGTFLKDLKDIKEDSKKETFKDKFINLYDNPLMIKSLIMQENSSEFVNCWNDKDVSKNDLLVINTDHEFLGQYERLFEENDPKYVLIPYERSFKRKVKQHRVLLDDKFKKQTKNSEYQNKPDEFYSDDHLFYKEEGFMGFSDYSIVGNEYLESGFAPYAVAIHIVYLSDKDKTLRIKHFVSNSNSDIHNPALKFYEAVSKLAEWYKDCGSEQITFGLRTLLRHYQNETYPGLGTVKKLSLMHHFELMSRYLSKAK